MQGIEVVNERLHGLMRLFDNILTGQLVDYRHDSLKVSKFLMIDIRQQACHSLLDSVNRTLCTFIFHAFRIAAGIKIHNLFEFLFELVLTADRLRQLIPQSLVSLIDNGFAEGFADTLCHSIIKRIDRLAAEHVILIALNRDAGQACIGADGVRLAQEAVPRRETAME